MKLQAGMAFEYELRGQIIRGRILKYKNSFTLLYKNVWGENFYIYLPANQSKVEYLESSFKGFRIIPITLDLLQVGDVIKSVDDKKRKVLGRVNDLIFPSSTKSYQKALNITYLIDELNKYMSDFNMSLNKVNLFHNKIQRVINSLENESKSTEKKNINQIQKKQKEKKANPKRKQAKYWADL